MSPEDLNELRRLVRLQDINVKELSAANRCFRLTDDEGKSECYFFIGADHEAHGERKYGICRMVPRPTQDDIRNISELTFREFYADGRVELL